MMKINLSPKSKRWPIRVFKSWRYSKACQSTQAKKAFHDQIVSTTIKRKEGEEELLLETIERLFNN